MALGHIGVSQQLTDVDVDGSAEAAACLVFYDIVVDEVFRAYPWSWATKHATLAVVGANPTTEWTNSYRFPADCVAFRRVLQASRVDAADTIIPFRISHDATGQLIYTNVASAVGEYTERVVDEAIYPADFASLVSLLLAHRAGPRLMKGDGLKLADRAFEKYAAELQVAISSMQQEERRRAEEITVASKPKEDICNAALAYLGVDYEISDLTTEKSLQARTMRQFYTDVRNEVLRSFPWSFATKITSLGAAVGANPNTEWGFSYRYPTDCIAVRKILDPSNRLPAGLSRVPFKLGQDGTGLLIYTDQTTAALEYTFAHDTPAQYPSDFKMQLALLLAIRGAPRLVTDAKKMDMLQKKCQAMYDKGLSDATLRAAIEERDLSPETVAATEPKEDICNAALMHLGLDVEVQDLETERTRPARVLRQFYGQVRDTVLRDFDWPFARKVAALTEVATDPTDEWQHAYRYPSDCLKVRRILSGSRQDTTSTAVPYWIANDASGFLIYSDETDAECEYTVKLDDPVLFYMADFRKAFEYALAARVAPALLPEGRDKLLKQQYAHQQYRVCIIQAQANALNEEQPDTELDSEFVRSR